MMQYTNGVCVLKKFAPQQRLKIMLLGICLFKCPFSVKIQWHQIPEHCNTELENNKCLQTTMRSNVPLHKSSSYTHTRSVEHHTQGIISNASSSGFSPHFYVSHFLCMMCPRAHLISQSSYFPHAKKTSIFQRKGYRHCSIDKIDSSSSDIPKHKIQQIPNRIPSIEEKIHSK